MAALGWICAGVLLVWFLASYRFSHKKRLNLNYYIVYLLLNDDIRESHKRKLEQWIHNSDAKDALSLALQAYSAVEQMADALSTSSPSSAVGAVGILWQVKTGKLGATPGAAT